MKLIRRPLPAGLVRDETGATMVEYIVVLVVVVIFCVVAWAEYQQTIENDASAEYTSFGTPP